MVISMTDTETVEDYVFRADNHLAVLVSADIQLDMGRVVRAIITDLHAYFQHMAAPLLYANSITTISDLRDGFENLNIMGNVPNNVPRRVEYGNAAAGLSIEGNYYENYDCHLCGKVGHISREPASVRVSMGETISATVGDVVLAVAARVVVDEVAVATTMVGTGMAMVSEQATCVTTKR